jgi:hypothetical protein
MANSFNQADLEAYLDEALPTELMARIEAALRADGELARALAAINSKRDAGVHSPGEIWRRHRLSCPSRQQLGSFLLGVLEDEHQAFISFHVETAGCRTCRANLDDLRSQEREQATPAVQSRRRKYFQSSAGHLRRK